MSKLLEYSKGLLLLSTLLQAACNTPSEPNDQTSQTPATELSEHIGSSLLEDYEPEKATSLHEAVRKGDVEVIRALLAQGSDINAKDNNGKTPLHWVAQEDHYTVAKLLLRQPGIDIKAKDNNGKTPLRLASIGVQRLIQDALRAKAKKLDEGTIFKNARPAIVRIISRNAKKRFIRGWSKVGRIGSGVIVDPRGYVVTNDHVIHRSKKPVIHYVVTHTGKKYEATLVYRDKDIDLALLKLQEVGEELSYMQVGDEKGLQRLEEVFSLGHAKGLEKCVCRSGEYYGLNKIRYAKGKGLIENTTKIVPGMSGGPVLDSYGNLIGINCMCLIERIRFVPFYKNYIRGYAVPASEVQLFLEKALP